MSVLSTFVSVPLSRFPLLCAVVSGVSAWLNVVLMVLFWVSHDYVWGSFFLAMIVISTILNLAGKKRVLALLQLKALSDTIDALPTFQKAGDRSKKLWRFSRKIWFTNLHNVPASFLIAYVLALNLNGRLNEPFLAICLVLSLSSFALCLSNVVALHESTAVHLLVIANIAFQFQFRAFAVCAICVRFGAFAVIAMVFLVLAAYLFAPMGLISSANSQIECHHALAKLSLTPLTFFVVVDITDFCQAKVALSSHYFWAWRVAENLLGIVLFLTLPETDQVRGKDEYSAWMGDEITVIVVTCVYLFGSVLTWGLVHRFADQTESYQPQVDNQPPQQQQQQQQPQQTQQAALPQL